MNFYEQYCSHCPNRIESEAPMGCTDCFFLDDEDEEDEEDWESCDENY